jgi:hexosaminidase
LKVSNSEGAYSLPEQLVIGYQSGLENEAELLKNKLASTGQSVEIRNNPLQGDIRLSIGSFDQSKSENYRLVVSKDHINVSGSDPAGVFYGTQSILSLWPLEAWEKANEELSIPCQTIIDAPRFPYRGLYLDVARNFQKPEAVKQTIDMMAHYKLNRLTFGVSNDEGWRLEIKGIPELTDIGARRGHTENELDHLYPAYGSGPDPDAQNNHGTGYYSRQEFIDILQYAQKRHVDIIPEINFPGHARAAVKSMEARTKRILDTGSSEPAYTLHDPNDESIYNSVQGYDDNVICPCQESVYQFLEAVVSDLVTIYQEARVKFHTVHTGGDEVPTGIWEKSPLCLEFVETNPQIEGIDGLSGYFLQRYRQILEQHQLVTAGWEEIAMHRVKPAGTATDSYVPLVPNPALVDQNLLPYVWNSDWGTADDLGYKLANLGYKVVLCNANNFYFDFAYNKDPMEPGFYWSGMVNTRKPYELVPLDLLQTATVDKMGNPIAVEIYEDHEKLTAKGAKNVLGLQGQLFSETVKGPNLLEYYLFPKMIGFVERAWAADPEWSNLPKKSQRLKGLDQQWNRFANSIAQRELPKLDYLWNQVNYRVPLPGAIIEEGQLKANVAFPGLTIRYTLDGSEPDENATVYQGPVEAKKPVKLKAFSKTGKASRTSLLDY